MKTNSSKKNRLKRREFIKRGAIASSIFIIPRSVLGGVGYTAPSDQLNLAGIGVGGKGRSDIANATVNGRERVAALCDVELAGKHGVTDSINAFPNAKLYEDFREMLDAEKDIDAVTISTADHTHAAAAMYAMERGIHVYVQKPLTHNIYEARMLTERAREMKVVSQMGNQGASNPDQLSVKEWIDSGAIGPVNKVYVWTNRPVWPQGIQMPKPDASKKPEGLNWDLWLGPSAERPYIPEMHPFNWRGWWDYGTGALGDMGCHIIDVPFRALELKYPTDVEASVGTVYSQMWVPDYIPEGCPPSSHVTIHFDATPKNPSSIEMIWMDGGIKPAHPELIPPEIDIEPNGVMMIGEKGIITSDVYGLNPKLYRKGEPTQDRKREYNEGEPEYGHQRKWVDACKAGFNSKEHKSLTSSFDYAGPLTETVLMGNIAIRSYLLRRENENGNMEYFGRKKTSLGWR